jgi:hypothetical protein
MVEKDSSVKESCENTERRQSRPNDDNNDRTPAQNEFCQELNTTGRYGAERPSSVTDINRDLVQFGLAKPLLPEISISGSAAAVQGNDGNRLMDRQVGAGAAAGLPTGGFDPIQGAPKSEAQQNLFQTLASDAPAEDKIRAANQLHAGADKDANGNLYLTSADGQRFRSEDQQLPSKNSDVHLRHLFALDGNGKEQLALRWVERDGQVEQQRDRTGRQVSFQPEPTPDSKIKPDSTVGSFQQVSLRTDRSIAELAAPPLTDNRTRAAGDRPATVGEGPIPAGDQPRRPGIETRLGEDGKESYIVNPGTDQRRNAELAQRAIDKAAAQNGGTVTLKDGVYSGHLNVHGDNLVLRAENNGQAVFDMRNRAWNANSVLDVRGNHNRIEGLTIQNWRSPRQGGEVVGVDVRSGSNDVTLDGLTIRNLGREPRGAHAVRAETDGRVINDVTVKNCHISDIANGQHEAISFMASNGNIHRPQVIGNTIERINNIGIVMEGSRRGTISDAVIQGNHIKDADNSSGRNKTYSEGNSAAVQIDTNVHGVKIDGNTFERGWSGVILEREKSGRGVRDVHITNNAFINNKQANVWLDASNKTAGQIGPTIDGVEIAGNHHTGNLVTTEGRHGILGVKTHDNTPASAPPPAKPSIKEAKLEAPKLELPKLEARKPEAPKLEAQKLEAPKSQPTEAPTGSPHRLEAQALRLPHHSANHGRPDAMVMVSPNFNPKEKFEVVMYFHGLGSTAESSVKDNKLDQQFAKSEGNKVFIAFEWQQSPGSRSSAQGEFGKKGTLDHMMQDVFDNSKVPGLKGTTAADVSGVSIFAHSAGGYPAATALYKNQLADKVNTFTALDSAGSDLVAPWLQANIRELHAGTKQYYNFSSSYTSEAKALSGQVNRMLNRAHLSQDSVYVDSHAGQLMHTAPPGQSIVFKQSSVPADGVGPHLAIPHQYVGVVEAASRNRDSIPAKPAQASREMPAEIVREKPATVENESRDQSIEKLSDDATQRRPEYWAGKSVAASVAEIERVYGKDFADHCRRWVSWASRSGGDPHFVGINDNVRVPAKDKKGEFIANPRRASSHPEDWQVFENVPQAMPSKVSAHALMGAMQDAKQIGQPIQFAAHDHNLFMRDFQQQKSAAANANVHATPGHSTHGLRGAVDLSVRSAENWAIRDVMRKHGFQWFGPGDVPHFSYVGPSDHVQGERSTSSDQRKRPGRRR